MPWQLVLCIDLGAERSQGHRPTIEALEQINLV